MKDGRSRYPQPRTLPITPDRLDQLRAANLPGIDPNEKRDDPYPKTRFPGSDREPVRYYDQNALPHAEKIIKFVREWQEPSASAAPLLGVGMLAAQFNPHHRRMFLKLAAAAGVALLSHASSEESYASTPKIGIPPRVEMIEINHCYNRETNDRRFIQVLYWNNHPGVIYHVQAWHMIDKVKALYFAGGERARFPEGEKLYPYKLWVQFECGGMPHVIDSQHLKVSHTYTDPEEDDRKVLPLEGRSSPFQGRGEVPSSVRQP